MRITTSAHLYATLALSVLANHPDKAWVSWLLDGITNGVPIGYNGTPQFPNIAHNLVSALQHPGILEKELSQEIKAEQVRGPFFGPPLPNFLGSLA